MLRLVKGGISNGKMNRLHQSSRGYCGKCTTSFDNAQILKMCFTMNLSFLGSEDVL